jgi:hypothetical protein
MVGVESPTPPKLDGNFDWAESGEQAHAFVDDLAADMRRNGAMTAQRRLANALAGKSDWDPSR